MPRFSPRHIRIISILVFLFIVIVGLSAYVVIADDDLDQGGQDVDLISKVYKLRCTDLVSVSVYGQDDLTIKQRIDGDGFIQMPLLGKVKIGERTIRECESVIEKELVDQKFLRSPQVSVHVEEYAPKSISVFGQVNKPGKIDFDLDTNAMDIVEVIALAGDFTGIAKKGDVVVTRLNQTGQEQKYEVNVQKRILGKDKEDPFWVYPGDVVFVPESLF